MMRSIRRFVPLVLMGGASLLLSACGGGSSLSRTFGFEHVPPDEFSVTTQAPLSMPPDFSLRPPLPGEPRPQAQSTAAAAEEALVPQTVLDPAPAAGMSPGQQALLEQAGPPAPANMAAQIDSHVAELNQPSRGFIDRLMFWRAPAPAGEVVDALPEAERLRKNAALGQSPTAGPTPIIQNREKGLLEGLF